MYRPSFQFYPADWKNNANLRRCSEAARGVWMDVLCLFHDSDEYGILRWPLSDIAIALGVKLKILRELSDKKVLKGCDEKVEDFLYVPRHAGKEGKPVILIEGCEGPLWYSSRLVRDEYLRKNRGGAGKFTSLRQPAPQPFRQPDRRKGVRWGDGASSSSSSSSSIIIESNDSIGEHAYTDEDIFSIEIKPEQPKPNVAPPAVTPTALDKRNPDVDNFIAAMKEKFDLNILDGTEKTNRRYAWLTIKKLKNIENCLAVIEAAAASEFWRNKITSAQDIYRHAVKIMSEFREANSSADASFSSPNIS